MCYIDVIKNMYRLRFSHLLILAFVFIATNLNLVSLKVTVIAFFRERYVMGDCTMKTNLHYKY